MQGEMNIAEALADYTGGIKFNDLPPAVVDCAKKIILDTWESRFLEAPCGDLGFGEPGNGLAGKAGSSIFIHGPKSPPPGSFDQLLYGPGP